MISSRRSRTQGRKIGWLDRDTQVGVEFYPAYRVLTVEPGPGYSGRVVSLARVRENPEEYLGPLRCDQPQAAYRQLVELAVTMPGHPLGLTFDGGIAVTHTDYRLAEQRWGGALGGDAPA